ncbi:MAG TPA: tryptophan--tRNA ligase, partial [Bacillota bacterium]|nr:tryptophan--tRNA ligase [Bacillota bacterium]
FSGVSIPHLEQKYAHKGYGDFKAGVAQAVITRLQPIQQRYHELYHSQTLDDILDEGAAKATEIANKRLLKAKKSMGLGRL